MINEIKDGSVRKIYAVLSVYKKKNDLSIQERLIVKEYEKILVFLNVGYVSHTYTKLLRFLLVGLAGYIMALFLHVF